MLNLGDINFGIDVDTSPLSASISRIVNFGDEVQKAARRTSEGSAEAAAALARQEKAALSALQATLNLQQRISSAGAPQTMIDQTSAAFDRLTRSMTSTSLSSLGFQRAQEGFQASMGSSRRALSDFAASAGTAAVAGTAFNVFLRDLSSAATLTFGPLSGIGARVTAMSGIWSRQNIEIAAAIVGFAAVTAVLGTLTKGAIDTALQLNIMQQRFQAIGGSEAFATEEMTHLHDEAERLGVNFLTLTDEFSKFLVAAQGSGLSMQQVTNIFDTFAAVGAKLHLPADEMERIFQVLQRMMSTGVVNATELRRQLSTALPGAFEQAAQAMGLTEEQLAKLSKQGQIFAVDLLPKMATQLQKFYGVNDTTKIDSLYASLNNVHNSLTDLFVAFDHSTGASIAFKTSLDTLQAAIQFFARNIDAIKAGAEALAVAMAAAFAPQILAGIVAIGGALRGVGETLQIITLLLAANPWTAFGGLLLRAAAAIGTFIAAYALFKPTVDANNDAIAQNTHAISDYIKSLDNAKLSESDFVANKIKETQQYINATEAQIAADKAALAQQMLYLNPGNQGQSQTAQWDSVAGAINVANSNLNTHQSELKTLQDDLTTLKQKYKDLQDQEQAMLHAKSQDQLDAIANAQAELDRMSALVDATYKGRDAVKSLQEQFAAQDKADAFIKKFKDLPPDMATAFKQAFTTMDSYLTNFMKPDSDIAQFSKIAQDTAQNFKLAAATIQGSGFKDALEKQFQVADKMSSVNDELARSSLNAGQAAKAAQAYAVSLQAVQDAEIRLQAIQFSKQISDNTAEFKALAQATTIGDGALQHLQAQFRERDEIKAFSDQVIATGIDLASAKGYIDQFSLSLQRIDAQKAANALAEVNLQANQLQQEIDLIKKGGSQDQLEALGRSFDWTATIKQTTSALMAQGVSLEDATIAATRYANMKQQIEALKPAILDVHEVWRSWREDVDKGAGDVAKALTDMARTGKFQISTLVTAVADAVQQMLTDFLKLQVIKPIFNSIFSALDIAGGGLDLTNGGLDPSVVSQINSLPIAGLRALGGPVVGGMTYVVGENGPELFTAPSDGTVIPNSALASSSTLSGPAGQGNSGSIALQIELATTPDFAAKVTQVATSTSQKVVASFSQKILPSRVASITADSKAR